MASFPPSRNTGTWHVADVSDVLVELHLRRLDKDPLVTWERAGEWKEECGSMGKGKENVSQEHMSFSR